MSKKMSEMWEKVSSALVRSLVGDSVVHWMPGRRGGSATGCWLLASGGGKVGSRRSFVNLKSDGF